eukprot:TRINITY_DN25145_c0_g1_i1.p1 TRINITY_DN25145_c0_g1~~TRINITY_DN25145_c0_g1_i1.p1  ORF type:complete len:168 (-),score=26.13 TRINITY_DN25145_c0_g1_i1:445-948(-)
MAYRYTRRQQTWDLGDKAGAICKGLCLAYTVAQYVVNVTFTFGVSMQPSLESGDVILSDQWTGKFKPEWLRRGALVSYFKPGEESPMIVMKRIVGLPGDVIVNRPPPATAFGVPLRAPLVVPPGHLWLEGDNKAKSIDSRDYGPVPMALVTGRSVAVVWPPSRMQFV